MDGEGVFFRGSAVRMSDVTDGTSSTLLAGERSFRFSEATWVGAVTGSHLVPPAGVAVGGGGTGDTGEGGWYGDGRTGKGGGKGGGDAGHVSYLSRSTSYATYKALSTRAGGEAISTGDY